MTRGVRYKTASFMTPVLSTLTSYVTEG